MNLTQQEAHAYFFSKTIEARMFATAECKGRGRATDALHFIRGFVGLGIGSMELRDDGSAVLSVSPKHHVRLVVL